MRLTTIKVPKGCTEIFVDVEDGKVIVSYGSSINSKEFFCEETDRLEEVPGVGDFAIFWNDACRGKAACMNYEGKTGKHYRASDQLLYDRAIKFRNLEQFLKVRGVYGEDEP